MTRPDKGQVSVKIDGVTHTADRFVASGVVTVRSFDLGKKSTQTAGSPPADIARMSWIASAAFPVTLVQDSSSVPFSRSVHDAHRPTGKRERLSFLAANKPRSADNLDGGSVGAKA